MKRKVLLVMLVCDVCGRHHEKRRHHEFRDMLPILRLFASFDGWHYRNGRDECPDCSAGWLD